jgi:hypothetical protein
VNETEKVELAKAYVALSNAHRLGLILPMFAEGATYHSSAVGEFTGRAAIGEMRGGFFSRFPDVRWSVEAYRYTENGAVEFGFVMTATEAETGNRIERKGMEKIVIGDHGQISYLEVRAQDVTNEH